MKLKKLITNIQLCFILAFLFSLSICPAELPSFWQGENLERLTSESSDIVMICVYKKNWAPPVRGVSKGQLKCYSRIVSVLKGGRAIGDKLLIVYNIEEAPPWLKEFEAPVDGELKYLFFSKDELIKKDDESYSFHGPNQSGFDYYDGSLTFLKDKIGPAETGAK